MSDWMNNLHSADQQKTQRENERQTIAGLRNSIVSYLVGFMKQECEKANQGFFNNIQDFCKVEEARYTHSDNEKYRNDFCVLIDRLPAAYLYVKFDSQKSVMTRLLTIVRDINTKRSDRELPPINIKLDDKGEPYLELDGIGLDESKISEAFLAPVVMYHKDGKL